MILVDFSEVLTDQPRSRPRDRATERARPSNCDRATATYDRPTTPPAMDARVQDEPAKEKLESTLANLTQDLPRTYPDRTTEAGACLSKAKQSLNASRNLKTDIKKGVTEAIDRLYEIVKELEGELKGKGGRNGLEVTTAKKPTIAVTIEGGGEKQSELSRQIEEHGRLLKEHKEEMKVLNRIKRIKKRCGYRRPRARPTKKGG